MRVNIGEKLKKNIPCGHNYLNWSSYLLCFSRQIFKTWLTTRDIKAGKACRVTVTSCLRISRGILQPFLNNPYSMKVVLVILKKVVVAGIRTILVVLSCTSALGRQFNLSYGIRHCRLYAGRAGLIKSLYCLVTHNIPKYVYFCSKIRCKGVEKVQKCVANMNFSFFLPFFTIQTLLNSTLPAHGRSDE